MKTVKIAGETAEVIRYCGNIAVKFAEKMRINALKTQKIVGLGLCVEI